MDYPQSRARVPRLDVLTSTSSTNTVLAELARTERPAAYTTVVTTDQRAGRGRLERAWTAPPGTSLAISVLIRVEEASFPVARLGWVPIAAGVAMCEALSPLVPVDVAFKWPNDVLIADRKVCGILAELIDPSTIVLGAGINLTMTAEQLPVPTATSLVLTGATETPDFADRVLAGYLGALRRTIDALAQSGGDAASSGLLARATELCSTLGRSVRVELPVGGVLEGRATGFDASGRLEVRTAANGVVAVSAGDVVHVR